VTAHAPSRDAVLASLRIAISRTGPFGAAGGLPGLVRVDRGKEFLCETVTVALGAFAVPVADLPAYSPHLKGTVESLNDAVEEMFLVTLPRYTHRQKLAGNRLADPDAPPLAFEAFVHLLLEWVAWWNTSHQPDALGGKTPLEAWRADPTPISDVAPKDLATFARRPLPSREPRPLPWRQIPADRAIQRRNRRRRLPLAPNRTSGQLTMDGSDVPLPQPQQSPDLRGEREPPVIAGPLPRRPGRGLIPFRGGQPPPHRTLPHSQHVRRRPHLRSGELPLPTQDQQTTHRWPPQRTNRQRRQNPTRPLQDRALLPTAPKPRDRTHPVRCVVQPLCAVRPWWPLLWHPAVNSFGAREGL
jgi:hypothetical protein